MKALTQASLTQAIIEIRELNDAQGPKLFIRPDVFIFHGKDRQAAQKIIKRLKRYTPKP